MSNDVSLSESAASGSDRSYTTIRPRAFPRRPAFVAALGLAAGFAALLAWYDRVDFYHTGFFIHGAAVTRYELARLVFIPYLAWLIYAVGLETNFLIFGREATADLPGWERFPLCFIIGTGLWHVVMFGIGLAGFDKTPVALTLAIGAMSFSIPHLAECLETAFNRASRLRPPQLIFESLATAVLWIFIAAAVVAFLLVKGLYPGGGHDYYKHYFQFYKRVVDTGSILPNDVWYHFYYSKGAGLYFLGMLLTDALAPQLVMAAFIGCGACIVYALLRRAGRSKLLPLAGVLLYVSGLINTCTYLTIAGSEICVEWSILEKLHELTAVLVLAVIWIAYRLFREEVPARRVWALALNSAIATIALLTLPLVPLVGLYISGYLLWFVLTRQWRITLNPLAAATTAGFSLLAIAALNYHYTGFPSDMALVQFWPYADLTKIMHWGTMLEILIHHRDLTYILAADQPISWDLVPTLAKFLRLDVWWPVFVASAPFLLLRLGSRNAIHRLHWREIDAKACVALSWFCAAVVLVAVFGGGRSQPESFYRISTFSYAPTLCFGLLLCQFSIPDAARGKKQGMLLIFRISGMLALAASAILTVAPGSLSVIPQNVSPALTYAANLWIGRFSLLDAYQNEPPPATPWGAIYPGIIEARRLVGPEAPIWSFHVSSYCMLPDCNVRESRSHRFSPSWQVVFFGNPEDAIKALQAEGLNYFFFSATLAMQDILPETQLFSPATIGKYLAIRWTDGTNYLLTWPGPNTRPIDRKFLFSYTKAVKTDFLSFDLNLLKSVSDHLDRHREQLRPFQLPWCKNCEGLPSIY